MPVKTEAKMLLSTSAFTLSVVTSLPDLLIRGIRFKHKSIRSTVVGILTEIWVHETIPLSFIA